MACEGEIKSAPRAPKAMGFMRFLNLEFMPGFKHCRKNSLEAPHGCQKASWQMGCNFMTWCKGWEEKPAWHVTAPVPPSTHPALQHSPWAAGPPCPAREALPEKLSWQVAIDPTKCCCKQSLTAWSVSRMKLRFIEIPLLKSQGYLSEFSGSPFAWRQDCADAQSLPFLFLQQQTLFFLKTRRVKPSETKTYVRG